MSGHKIPLKVILRSSVRWMQDTQTRKGETYWHGNNGDPAWELNLIIFIWRHIETVTYVWLSFSQKYPTMKKNFPFLKRY